MSKHIVIVGATGSIGKAAAFELAKRNCNLVLLGKNENKVNQLKVEISQLYPLVKIDTALVDLAEPESVQDCCRELKNRYTQLNGLINAAATYETTRKVNSLGIELMFATNHLGPYQLIVGVLDLLKAAPSARIMNISAPSSTKLNFDDLFFEKKFSAIRAYEATKTANLLFTFKLAQLVSWTYVSAFAFHPGVVKSNLLNNMPTFLKILLKNVAREPDKVSKVIAYFMLNNFEDTLNAHLVKIDGSIHEPSPYFKSVENLNQLWDISHELTLDRHSIH